MKQWRLKGASLIAGFLGLGLIGTIMSLAGLPARAQQADITELALRAIGGPGGAERVGLLPGELADNMPLDLPLSDGTNLVGTIIQNGENGFMAWEVVLDVPSDPMDVGMFYEESFPFLGWNPPPGTGETLPPGFFCQSADGPWAAVVAVPVSDQASDVHIRVESGTPGPCAGPPSQP